MFTTQSKITDLTADSLSGSSTLLQSEPLSTHLTDTVHFTGSSQVAFVDAALPDYQTLVAGLEPGTDVYLLNSTAGDELSQMTQVLAGYSNLSAISLFSHGSDGALQLGNSSLNSENLVDYAGVLQSWVGSLSAEGDLLLYGCDLAADASGQSFVQQIATLTGADVAASTDLTGSSVLGGDWDLEFSTGSIEATPVLSDWAQAAYQNVLDLFVVTTLADTMNANDGVLSLREAISQANVSPVSNEIRFSVSGTITLKTDLTIDTRRDGSQIFIYGRNAITVSGGNATRVFSINSGAKLSLDGLTISGGRATGIYDFGGGIFNAGGTVTVSNSTISNNSADKDGGGIINSGTLTVSNSTISNNRANYNGGGIYNAGGTLNMGNSTITNNAAYGSGGGGIYNAGGTLNMSNSLIAGNIIDPRVTGREIYSSKSVTSGGYNLFGSRGNSGLVSVITSTGDIIPSVDFNQILKPLANNGGSTQTYALASGSPAINAGNPNYTGGTGGDQRGFSRVSGGRLDIGAYEVQMPVARLDYVTANQSSAKNIPVSVLLANDRNPEGLPLRIVSVSNPINGTVSLNNNGTATNYADDYVVFTPNSGFSGRALFTYTMDFVNFGRSVPSSARVDVIVGITRNGTDGNDTLNGTDGDDILSGLNGNDGILGSFGNDRLFGGFGNDNLNGGEEGDDYLDGGMDQDILTGGTEKDTFVLRSGDGVYDVIKDFKRSEGDKLGLANGLRFDQLRFGANYIFYGSQILALLDGINTTTLTANDFTTV